MATKSSKPAGKKSSGKKPTVKDLSPKKNPSGGRKEGNPQLT